jgi:hypothetical protein
VVLKFNLNTALTVNGKIVAAGGSTLTAHLFHVDPRRQRSCTRR